VQWLQTCVLEPDDGDIGLKHPHISKEDYEQNKTKQKQCVKAQITQVTVTNQEEFL
jgi:hypothetical protein